MKFLLLVSLLFSISACEKDPYPEAGNQRVVPRDQRSEVPPALSSSIPPVMNLKEGKFFKHSFKVSVPVPGIPVMSVDQLPAGAKFDEKTLTLTWTPSYFDGNDLKDPTIKNRQYEIIVWLRSSVLDPSEMIKSTVVIDVQDVPQAFTVDASTYENVDEGSTLNYEFSIENPDYPTGPFNVFSSGLPANTRIEKITENRYKLVFSPDYQHVKINNNPNPCARWSSKDCLKYVGSVTITNPAGHKTVKQMEVRVDDVRQDVDLATPDNMEQGLDISFSVSSVDPNGEVAPLIRMRSGQSPTAGDFNTSLKKDEENNFSVLQVSWKDIPPTYNGKSHTFYFESCVLDSSGNIRNCDQNNFKVDIVVKERKAPVFSRSSWEVGEIKYFKHNESDSFYVSADDGDTGNTIEKLEIKPEKMKEFVSYRNGRIFTNFDKTGIHQFSLVATSEYNVSSAESFIAEVFRPDRSKTLYFTDSTRDNEVKFYRDIMKNVQLMNPVLQALNDRNIAGRDTLIIGTGILQDTQMKANIEMAMDKIENVVIASPLIQNMPDNFLEELQTDFRVSITGRYSGIKDAPALKDMYFVARGDLERSKNPMSLKLDSTVESHDPLVFAVGVDRKNCQDVLDFTNKKKDKLYKIGVICDRSTGGRYAILGTEFSDLKAMTGDEEIPAKWLRSMLSIELNEGNK